MLPQEWLNVLKTAYLQGFIRRGGSAVKFAVVDEAQDTKAGHRDSPSHDYSKASFLIEAYSSALRNVITLFLRLFIKALKSVSQMAQLLSKTPS